ncbi:MAG: hypothetical protein LBS37_11190 [Treponema sp.]|nr:hypothetical protein [Treponema sp.]
MRKFGPESREFGPKLPEFTILRPAPGAFAPWLLPLILVCTYGIIAISVSSVVVLGAPLSVYSAPPVPHLALPLPSTNSAAPGLGVLLLAKPAFLPTLYRFTAALLLFTPPPSFLPASAACEPGRPRRGRFLRDFYGVLFIPLWPRRPPQTGTVRAKQTLRAKRTLRAA